MPKQSLMGGNGGGEPGAFECGVLRGARRRILPLPYRCANTRGRVAWFNRPFLFCLSTLAHNRVPLPAEAVPACTVVLRPGAKTASGGLSSGGTSATSRNASSGAGSAADGAAGGGAAAAGEFAHPLGRWGRVYMMAAFALMVALVNADQNLLAPNVSARHCWSWRGEWQEAL